MIQMKRKMSLGCLLLGAALAFVLPVQAQVYPNKMIKMVVPFPPGGGTDASARLVATKMQEILGQTVIVENRAGANGNIGAEAVFRSAPDGYTILFGSPGPITISKHLYPDLKYDPDLFVPISMVAEGPAVLVVAQKVAAGTMQQLIALAKSNPGKLNYASQGIGSGAHLTAATFEAMTGTKLTHIPYKGSAPALSDLMSGHVDMMFAELSTALPGIRTGTMRPLGVGSEKRTSLLPGIPTMSETVPGMVAVNWQAIVVPPGTPAAIVDKLSAVVAQVLKQPDVVKRFNELSLETIGSTPAATAVFLKQESERWGKVVRSTGTTVN